MPSIVTVYSGTEGTEEGGGETFVTYCKMLNVFGLVRLQTATYRSRINRDLHKIKLIPQNCQVRSISKTPVFISRWSEAVYVPVSKFYLTLHLISSTTVEKTDFTTRYLRSFSFSFQRLSTLCRTLRIHLHKVSL